MDDVKLLKRKIERLKKSQSEAERLLEEKSKELYDLNKGLEMLVEIRTQQMQQARDSAINANEAKSQFLANMSHEIRTPLNGMLGFIGLLQKSKLTENQREQLSTVSKSGHLLLSIINDILEFSKIEAGKMELEKAPFNLKEAVEDIVDVMSNQVYEKGLELPVFLDENIPSKLLGDESRIRQVLINLIGNAVKFTPTGEIFVRATLSGENHEGHPEVSFEVIDTGVGIPKSKLDTVFKAFEQADVSDTRKYGGTGLGLTISRTIVNAMGGQIRVESEETVGTRFFFTVPLERAENDAPQTLDRSFDNSEEVILSVINNSTRSNLMQRFEGWGAICSETANLDTIEWASKGTTNKNLVVDHHCLLDTSKLKIVENLIEAGVHIVALCPPKERTELSEKFKDRKVDLISKPIKRDALFTAINSKETLVEKSKAKAAELEEVATITSQKHLLLAEDNLINQQVAIAMLKVHGFTADIANNGEEAFNLFDPDKHSLILMDCQMPVMDGFEATQKIIEKHPETTIIAMTANAFKQTKEQCFEVGMKDFITKPVTDKALAEVILKNLVQVKKAL